MVNRLLPVHVTSRYVERLYCFLSIVLLVFSVSGSVVGGDFAGAPPGGAYKSRYGGRCERITVPLCLDMKYNMTRMPNLVGQTNQGDAASQVHEFVPLIQFGCSRLLKFFLCSMYAPMCTVQVDEPMVIPACRSMCLEVRQKCEPVLQQFNFNWPQMLDCSALPERTDRGSLCIDLPPPAPDDVEEIEYQAPPGSPGVGSGTFVPSSRVAHNPEWTKLLNVFREGSTGKPVTVYSGSGGDVIKAVPTHRCPDRFVATVWRPPSSLIRHNETVDAWTDCAPRCGVDVMFRAADKDFMSTWLTVWATLSLASSLFAVLTFLIEPTRFDYPERPVVFLAVCFVFYSSAILLRIAAGADTVSCDSPRVVATINTQPNPTEVDRYVIREGLESVWCLAVFLLLYFFGTAGTVWWSLLAVAWFLASARKWSREAIRSYAGYIHLVGWSLPTIQTIVVLAIRRVDGDELTGLCHVGNQDALAMLVFVLGPLAVYLVVGTVFIVLGFAALFGVRQDLKLADNRHGGHQTINSLNSTTVTNSGAMISTDVRKLEKLMARIGLFSGLYVAAMCCHLAAICYQQVGIKRTIEKAMRTQCGTSPIDGSRNRSSIQQSCALSESFQSIAIYTLKVTSPLVIGIANGLWMMSTKTLKSWSSFLCRCCRSRPPQSSSSRSRQRTNVGSAGRYPAVSGESNRVQLLRTANGTRQSPVQIYANASSSYPPLNRDKVGALSMTTII